MKLYVGNISHDATEDDLREVFGAFGSVESINIIMDKFSGESRGFGFVEMPEKSEALTAIKEADGKEVKGRALKVNEAHDRPKGGDRRGGGGGGGGRGRGGFGGGGGGGGRGRGGGGGGGGRGRGGGGGRGRESRGGGGGGGNRY